MTLFTVYLLSTFRSHTYGIHVIKLVTAEEEKTGLHPVFTEPVTKTGKKRENIQATITKDIKTKQEKRTHTHTPQHDTEARTDSISLQGKVLSRAGQRSGLDQLADLDTQREQGWDARPPIPGQACL